MHHTSRQPLRSQAKTIARRREEEKATRFRKMLALSVMSALTLGAIMLARAETWVTVNPDGSTTRTEVRTQAQAVPVQSTRSVDVYPDQQPQGNFGPYNGTQINPNTYSGVGQPVGNTTFFAGTHYPVPTYSYSYPIPGYTYPVGPVLNMPNYIPPTITTLPSTGRFYGYGNPHGHHGHHCGHSCYPAYPVYVYPNYATSGVYYSGPAGGGGTIYSSSSTSNRGFGINGGSNGVNITFGNTQRTSNSTTTVTTYGAR